MRRPTQPHELLEQELSILLQGQDGGSPGNEADTYGDGQSEDIKKRVRTIKNRLAAKKSREQARSYVQELESNLSRMRQQNEDLARRLALAEAENDALKRNMKTPLCPNTAAPTNNKNCESEPAAGRSSLVVDSAVIAGVRKSTSAVTKPPLPSSGAGHHFVDARGRAPIVPEPTASGTTPLYFTHVPQYTGVTSAGKKRKLSSISVPAGNLSEVRKSQKPEPAPQQLAIKTPLLGVKQEIDEPPQLVESPHSMNSPLSDNDHDDAAWLDDVVLDNGDPRAMLEQLMKDEPASPLSEASGLFSADASMWCC